MAPCRRAVVARSCVRCAQRRLLGPRRARRERRRASAPAAAVARSSGPRTVVSGLSAAPLPRRGVQASRAASTSSSRAARSGSASGAGSARRRSSTCAASSPPAASRACSGSRSTRSTRRTGASTSSTPTATATRTSSSTARTATRRCPRTRAALLFVQRPVREPQRRHARLRHERPPLLLDGRRRLRRRPREPRPEPALALRQAALADVATRGLRIEALGLRNPWRFSFDRATGDL